MKTKYPAELESATSCYWGKKCGQCKNCLLYGALEDSFFGRPASEAALKEFLRSIGMYKIRYGLFFYYRFYEAIRELTRQSEYKYILKDRFGRFLGLSKTEAERQLTMIRKTKLMPKDFRLNFGELGKSTHATKAKP